MASGRDPRGAPTTVTPRVPNERASGTDPGRIEGGTRARAGHRGRPHRLPCTVLRPCPASPSVPRPSTATPNRAGPPRSPDDGPPPSPVPTPVGKSLPGCRADPRRRARRLGLVACVTLAGCAGQAHVPISTRSAAFLRQAGAADLDVRLTLAHDCAASVRAHPLPPAERAELGAALGP